MMSNYNQDRVELENSVVIFSILELNISFTNKQI